MSSRRRLAVGLLSVAALAIAWPVLGDATLAALLLVQVASPMDSGPLYRVTGAPQRETVTFPGGGRTMVATLYRSPGRGAGIGVILVHGVNETGKDDERIVWLADLLARSGFTVLTPDFLGFKSLTLRSSDVEELVASIRYLVGRLQGVPQERVGLIGFSYGAGPTIIAAADARVRDRVRFVVSFGGYYDLTNVITFITTGYYEFGVIHGRITPNEYVRWIFLRYNLGLIPATRDRTILQEIAEAKASNFNVDADPLATTLSPEGHATYDLLVNRDPGRVPDLIGNLGANIREQIRFLSPARVMGQFQGRLFVVHSDPDEFMPLTESLRLAAALEERGNVHLAVLRTFEHVRPSFPSLTVGNFLRVYVPEGGKLFWLVFDLLRQRRGGWWT